MEKSYMMIPSIVKNLNFQYAYFFGKKLKCNFKQKYIYNLFWFYYIFIYLFFCQYINKIFIKNYLINFCKLDKKFYFNCINNKFYMNFNIKNFVLYNLNFKIKLFLVKNFIFLQNKILLNTLKIFKKKFILLKLFS